MENEDKNLGGRPTKYKEEFCDAAEKYFGREPYTKHEVDVTDAKGNTHKKTVYEPCDFPTLAGFAVSIGVHRETVRNWANEVYPEDYEDKSLAGTHVHPRFFATIKKATDYQENILVTNGLKGLYEQPAFIFVSKNVLGWKDRVDVEAKHSGEVISGAAQLAATLQKLLDKDMEASKDAESGQQNSDTDNS